RSRPPLLWRRGLEQLNGLILWATRPLVSPRSVPTSSFLARGLSAVGDCRYKFAVHIQLEELTFRFPLIRAHDAHSFNHSLHDRKPPIRHRIHVFQFLNRLLPAITRRCCCDATAFLQF